MIYIVKYVGDDRKNHMTFVRTIEEVEFLKERFYEITVELQFIQ